MGEDVHLPGHLLHHRYDISGKTLQQVAETEMVMIVKSKLKN
jgi:hypothetical protein